MNHTIVAIPNAGSRGWVYQIYFQDPAMYYWHLWQESEEEYSTPELAKEAAQEFIDNYEPNS